MSTKCVCGLLIISSILSVFIGCSSQSTLQQPIPASPQQALEAQANLHFLQSGSIAISHPIPLALLPDQNHMLGFMPIPANQSDLTDSAAASLSQNYWLQINTKTKQLSLMQGQQTLESASLNGVDHLKIGQYQLAHKQRNPLWYAPPSYFEARNLPVPPEGDKSRYLRGALGDFALFLDKDTPIHSGPIASEEIGGVRLDDNQISKVYYLMNVGSAVIVR